MPHPDNPPALDVQNDDESIRVDIAVRALGDMRSRASVSSPEARASSRNSRNGEQDDSQQQPAPGLVARMTSFPLVGTAIRAYEQGKASSRVVKYGAEMVESSVKTISKPVIDRLPVNQIDEFACRQLDRLDRYRRPSTGPEPTSPRSPVSPSLEHSPSQRRLSDVSGAGSPSTPVDQESERGRPKLRTKTLDGSIAPEQEQERYRDDEDVSMERRPYVGSDRSVPQWIQTTHRASGSGATSPTQDSRIGSPLPSDEQRTKSPGRQSPDHQTSSRLRHWHSSNEVSQSGNQNPERQVAQRSRWQAMLLEAGGLGMALSDENMRRLKYCLHWLQYATAHIDAQILILRDFMESIQPLPQRDSHPHRRPPISEEQLRKLTEVRKDIVSTIRQMVDVVSKYAGGALPEPARGKVRGFILKLPQRWATRTAAAGVAAGSAMPGSSGPTGVGSERERETVAAAGSSTGVLRRGQGREKRAAQRERGTNSRATSPSPPDSHITHSGSVSVANQQISHSNATAAAQRILSLATESLDMMRNVTSVVKDSLDRADAWVNRLRMVGVQRGGQDGSAEEGSLNEEFGPPRVGSQYETGQTSRNDYRSLFQGHRRGRSGSSPGEDETSFSGSTPASPFTTTTTLSYLSNSSYTAPSSMPSTPTGVSFTSPPISTSGSIRDLYGGGVANAPSPGAIPLASMHITSRYNTPKIDATGLPSEDVTFEDKAGEPLPLRRSSLSRMDVDS